MNEDLTLAKWFNFTEKLRLQFAVQMFNAFNHANFGIPGASVGSPNLGLSSSTQGARQMQGVLEADILGLPVCRRPYLLSP